MGLFDLFGLLSPVRRLKKIVEEINALEPEIIKIGSEFLPNETEKLKAKLNNGATLDDVLPRAFALVRDAAKRTLGQRHYDAQLMGGIVLAEGKIAEMRTGEGKTLAATAPVYLHALKGEGVHVVTVNEYLAKRDAVWMGQIYHALGMKVSCLVHEGALMYDPDFVATDGRSPKSDASVPGRPSSDTRHPSSNPHAGESALLDKERDTTGAFLVQDAYLRPISRREAYAVDITYGTNHEFGFDYLRDNLAYRPENQVQRGWPYAIIDEIDSILIDEARTPLIISAPDEASSDYYKTFARAVARLEKGVDYLVDEKFHSADLTEVGIDKIEREQNIASLFAPENVKLVHYLQESLKACGLYTRDKDYVVKNGEVIIVDQFTGRMMLGRRYSGGLHQAIEAKEGVRIQEESRTYAQISIQNYFRLYKKLGGMTGTAQTSAEEFDKVYKLEVTTIPTNRQMIRKDESDFIYKTNDAKYKAIIEDIRGRHEHGQPVLLGTVSIEKNETVSRLLTRAGIPHEILNAKNNEREGAIIAQAGRGRAVTVATNMAGRGVDIILGGNPPDALEAQKVKEAGGLHVIGTERHEARRIDNQLRGRAGRQGDPGSSRFFMSMEDDLMRVFGGDRIKGLMEKLDVPDDMPLESGIVSRAIGEAQARVEGFNFDARKHLLEYDDVLNRQRLTIYKKRREVLEGGMLKVESRKEEGTETETIALAAQGKAMSLSMLDMLWMNHLADMEALSDSVRLRAYGQHDPLAEYKHEGHKLYKELLATFDMWVAENSERLISTNSESVTNERIENSAFVNSKENSLFVDGTKAGRNDPCPCGAKKPDGAPIKYKHCHGK